MAYEEHYSEAGRRLREHAVTTLADTDAIMLSAAAICDELARLAALLDERLPAKEEAYAPMYVHRALALVEIAIRSEEGAAAVRRMTGGNAPELVQGILDGIEGLRAAARAAKEADDD